MRVLTCFVIILGQNSDKLGPGKCLNMSFEALVAKANNVKKMCQFKNFSFFDKRVIPFVLPRLYVGKSWYVGYSVFDPVTGKMRRKKVMLDRYKTKRLKMSMASIAIKNISDLLISGWNPFVRNEKSQHYTSFEDIVTQYTEYLHVMESNGALKGKTVVDYTSRLKHFSAYINGLEPAVVYVHQIDESVINNFLDYLLAKRGCGARTRNNYRIWLSTFCSWLVERKHLDKSPVTDTKMLKNEQKKRDPLSPVDLQKLSDYTRTNCPAFYLACLMEYYTFVRPNELRFVRIGDIRIKEQSVLIHGEASKNGKTQAVGLNDKIIMEMIDQGVFQHPSSDYLFGKSLRPGPEQLPYNSFAYYWNNVRKELGFPQSYQFYSLKDSGIRDLANSNGIVVARDQARHSDISITNKYIKNQNVVHEEIKHYKGGL